MIFNFDFAKNTNLTCFFYFLLIIDLNFLIPAVIIQNFNPIVEPVIPTGISNKETKAEIEIHPATAEAKVRERSI